jgi:exosortase/archaeosortase family protein
LTLSTGQLGVVDACSGALSLTSLLAIAVLTAYARIAFRRDFTVFRGITLVALTIPIVVLSNTVRVIVSGLLHEYVGPAAIQGVWHEALGYMVVLVGFGLILGTSQLLVKKEEPNPPTPVPETGRGEKTIDDLPLSRFGKRAGGLGSSILALAFLVPAAAVCVWAGQVRRGQLQFADLNAIPLTLSDWDGKDEPVPPDVAEMLKCDQLLHREYSDKLGRTAEVYFMFWATPASTAHIHHPDVCWPARGCTLAGGRVRPVPYAASHEPLGVSVRHYDNEFGKREIVFYWTQNGNAVLPDGRGPADRVSEYAWVVDMLRGKDPPERVSRLSVLVATDVPVGRPADQEDRLAALSGQIAAELYRVCPWATPPR